MKQIPFTNHKGEEFLFVWTPKDAYDFKIFNKNNGKSSQLYYQITGDLVTNQRIELLPKGYDYKLISPLSEMTEELWKGIVDEQPYYDPTEPLCPITFYKNYDIGHFKETATESGESLLKSLDIIVVNPYEEKPELRFYNQGNAYPDFRERKRFESDLEQWQEAEDRTGNWQLIKKIK